MRFLILALLYPSFLFAQNPIDVQHYRFEIELDDRHDTIYGKAFRSATQRTAAAEIAVDTCNLAEPVLKSD